MSHHGAVRLLEADPDLGAALNPADLPEARRTVLGTRVVLETGACQPDHWPTPEGGPPVGAVVLTGLLLRDRAIADAVGSEVFGPGDVLDPWTPDLGLLHGDVRWRAATDVVVALLDASFLAGLGRWPALALPLLGRANEQAARLSVHATVHGISRVEDRLLAFLWSLAGRYGRVRPGGSVAVPLRLTHEALGRFIGARRPTVSLALKALANAGLVATDPEGGLVLKDRGRAVLEPPTGTLGDAPRADVRALQPFGPPTALADEEAGHRDALSRLRAEIALLRGSEGEIRALLDLAGIGVVLVDRADGRILRVNDRFADIVGRGRRALLGIPVRTLGGTAGRTGDLSALDRPGAVAELEIERPDGTVVWVRANVATFPDRAGGPARLLGVVEDVTDRHRAEAAVDRDLRDTRLLRDLAAELIAEDEPQVLYQRIAAAARELMDADASTVQLYRPDSGTLEILAADRLDDGLRRRFASVDASSTTSCGRALATGRRQSVRFDAPAVSGSEAADAHLAAGLRQALSTPLVGRSGRPVGMVTTHLREPAEPSERRLRFLDLLVRQAADLVERRQVLDELEAANRALRARVSSLDARRGGEGSRSAFRVGTRGAAD